MYNVRALVDRAGALVERYVYDPYGKPLIRESAGRGDHNNDAVLNGLDISPFVAARDSTTWDPRADLNDDGLVDATDSNTAFTTKQAIWNGSSPTVAQAFSDVGNPFMFQGRPNFPIDTALNVTTAKNWLNDFRNRFADPTGRWLTRDPIGYADGMNLYEQVKSSPTSLSDPWGLDTPADDMDALDDGSGRIRRGDQNGLNGFLTAEERERMRAWNEKTEQELVDAGVHVIKTGGRMAVEVGLMFVPFDEFLPYISSGGKWAVQFLQRFRAVKTLEQLIPLVDEIRAVVKTIGSGAVALSGKMVGHHMIPAKWFDKLPLSMRKLLGDIIWEVPEEINALVIHKGARGGAFNLWWKFKLEGKVLEDITESQWRQWVDEAAELFGLNKWKPQPPPPIPCPG